ncbi:MAG: hypothetical protein A3I09_01570 [Deltaproteobacteria bacterium RIFCSPLOWO2_02_FULL_47_10]|nr:MAG: hypothetical protein A3I09_01570 [Deltaproteobacteria bacterium RIFCSPLOWO2_02_FULL_47_10]
MTVIIIGSGFAGASCAWWLARLGVRDVIVLEREEMPGLHASGLNAGMARSYEEDETIAPLAREGIDFILNPPEGFTDKPLIECNGSLLLNPDRWTPTDGVVDIHAYLWAFINGAKAGGIKFLFGKKITDIKICPHDIIVNAAGAWAQEIANLEGAEDLDIKSYRRHLYCTPPMPDINPKWPFVWDIENKYYFRPESGGLLLSACDEEEVAPGTPPTNPKIREALAEKLMKFCPSFANVSIAREWCGLRTFAPDRRPVIRWDKKIRNFFWLTALGGRGVTCAASAGRIAAEEVLKCLSV